MKPLYIFQHVPKSAGTTFLSILENNIPNTIRYPRGFTPAHGWDHFDCIHGHFKYSMVENDPAFANREKIWFTFLRDPVQRCLSYYYYSRGFDAKTGNYWIPLDEYLTDYKASNHIRRTNAITNYIGDGCMETAMKRLQRFNVGITEHFDESLQRFQKKYPDIFKTIKYQRKNVTKDKPKEFFVETIFVAAENNIDDLKIYMVEYAKFEEEK